MLYYVGFIFRVHIDNSFVHLVLRVSIDDGARAPSHYSLAPKRLHNPLFF